MFQILEILRIIGIILGIVILCIFLWVFVIVRIIRKFYPFPIPSFLTNLIDNPFRRKFLQNPEKIAERMNLKPDMVVLEIGPGKGNYTKAVSKQILPNGKLYAIDISEDVIERLKGKIEEEKIPNIIPKVDDAYSLSFEDESIDRIFAITCLPEIPEPVRALKEFKRVLRPNGIISLCELLLDPDYPFRKTEKKWAKEAGLKLEEEFGNWFVYQLNFTKS